MINYKIACKVYGIKPLTKDDESKLTSDEKIIRQTKIDIVNMCNEVRKTIDNVDSIAVNIPEDNTELKNKLINLRIIMRNIISNIDEIRKELN